MRIGAYETSDYEVYPIRTTALHFINYCYLLVDKATRYGALIDPSWEWGTIVQAMLEREVKLASILLTHSHHDHTNLVKPLVQQYHVQAYMSEAEIDYYSFHCANLNPLQDGDEIAVGHVRLTSILTPGHTAGSMCFYTDGVMFTGDTIFIEGCGKCDRLGGSAGQMFDSVQKMRAYPAATKIYPGHSFGAPPGQMLGSLFRDNIYFAIQKKETFVQFRMRRNQPSGLAFQ